jgi:hypothetical protein
MILQVEKNSNPGVDSQE